MKELPDVSSRSKRYLSVRSRVLLTVFFGLVILYAFLYFLTNEVLSKSYLEIEREEVIQDIDRATEAINDEVYLQYENLLDWSPWDDMYFYTEEYALEGTKNREFEEGTMFATGYIRQDQNGYFVTDNEGDIYYAVYLDLKNEVEVASSTIVDFFEPQTELIVRTSEEDFKYGLVMMPQGPALFASKPSLTNEETGPVYSSIALVRYLDDGKMQGISDALGLHTQIFQITSPDLPEDVRKALELLLTGEQYVVSPKNLSEIQGYTLINDVEEEPALIVRIETARPIFTQGQKTILFFLLSGFAALIVFAIFITSLLEKLVVRRFVRLSKDVETINKEKNIENLVDTGVADDIGRLGIKINQMLQWLSAAQKAEKASKQKVLNLLKQVEKGKEMAELMVLERTKELETEKARLLTSINSLAFGFLIIDANGRIILHNPAVESILRIKTVPPVISEVAFADLGSVFVDMVENTKKTKALTEIKEQPYKNFYLRLVCVPVFTIDKTVNKNSKVIGYVLVVDDITDAKNTERSREEFFSIASHELRTPLTAIRWNTHMLLSGQASDLKKERKQRLVTDVYNASIRLISIVDDFLEVSRLEQKKLAIKMSEFDMVELAKNSLETYTEYARQKNIKLIFKSTLKSLATYADEMKTKQVLDNLIGNSLRYTHEGSITLEVLETATSTMVRITDTGLGISDKNKGRLFKKFQQAGEDMLAREDGQSTGLGLYISKLVLSEMNGTIELERSELGEGSTFFFTLPKA